MTKRLLPFSSPNTAAGTPAFSMRISSDLQQLLSRNALRLKLIVKDGELTLKAGGQSYALDTHPEFNATECFKHLSQSSLKSVGSIKSRLQINTPISSPASSTSSISEKSNAYKKTSPPPESSYLHQSRSTPKPAVASNSKSAQISRRLIHCLALGPATRDELLKKTNISSQELDSLLETVSRPWVPRVRDPVIFNFPRPRANADIQPNEHYYVLNYNNYKDLRLGEWKYSDKELEILKETCHAVYDYLEYPSSHPARATLAKLEKTPPSPTSPKKSQGSKKSSTAASTTTATSQTKSDQQRARAKQEKKSSNEPTRNSSSTPTAVQHQKHETNDKKRKLEETTQGKDVSYLDQLAERFRSKYKEYERLYKEVQRKQKKDDQELKKLYDMHRSLESWKRQLWSSVTN